MRVVQLESKKLVGIRVVCEGDQYVNEIPKAAKKLEEQVLKIKNVIDPNKMIGGFVVGDYLDEEDGYWVCVEVEEYDEIPAGMVTLTVPEQRYAVITHTGSNREIRNSYEALHHWINENGLERVLNAWHLEITKNWRIQESNSYEIDLYDTIK
ncbi:GyrI-like domain-containing protein [Paenibacillus prosopidis]|uniref:Putative transcriptional regulator YdeE n=1 Tax=Paenibacillus prosopidis TaxID=630520 RepID=A0A368WA15_9BACL|nr:GyrI-like domain-containing protein [Paenibacillus prosopidis]RCW50376.1 putative transcriptional regulator YdeE [Paenibacillus prosopidis]